MSILTVRQLTAQIKDAVESGFPYVWVRGEVTNVSRPSSGHIYFSLKDENALLQAVWFKGSQKERETFDPLTGEVFEDGPRMSLARTLRNGQQVICAGRLTVYAPRGGYQLVVELAQDSGEGQLHLALEALKRKLAEKGYFSLERKRPIPEHPHRVAVITAPSGAAIRDFLRLSGERGTGCEIRIHPVPVQGDDAPPCIAEALDDENRRGWADVLVLIRGGGSLQDLWAFNDERVAGAVYRSRIPVVAATKSTPPSPIWSRTCVPRRQATPRSFSGRNASGMRSSWTIWKRTCWKPPSGAFPKPISGWTRLAGLWRGFRRNAALPGLRSGSAPLPAGWISRWNRSWNGLMHGCVFWKPECPATRSPVCWIRGWSKRRL